VIVYRAEVASTGVYGLAEGPLWDAERERVLWVDVNAARTCIGEMRSGQILPTGQIDLEGAAGAVVCSTTGELLVAGGRELHTIGADGIRSVGIQLIASDKASRLNDGACDPAGRFLVGSVALDGRQRQEVLYRIDRNTEVTIIDNDLTLSNGLAWSPDGTRFYSVDSIPGVVWVRPYDALRGTWGQRDALLHVEDGLPDGLCVDSEGNLWIAIWGAGQVRCYTPGGEHIATVEVPAPNTSSAAFVGRDRGTLLVTTAREGLSPAQLLEFPHSGHLFTAQVDVIGHPTTPWVSR